MADTTTFKLACQSECVLFLSSPAAPRGRLDFPPKRRWKRSWIFILRSLHKHLLLCFDGVGVRTTHPSSAGSPGWNLLPVTAGLQRGQAAGGRATVFSLGLSQNVGLFSAEDQPTTILSLGPGQFSPHFPARANVGACSCAPCSRLRLCCWVFFTSQETSFSKPRWS